MGSNSYGWVQPVTQPAVPTGRNTAGRLPDYGGGGGGGGGYGPAQAALQQRVQSSQDKYNQLMQAKYGYGNSMDNGMSRAAGVNDFQSMNQNGFADPSGGRTRVDENGVSQPIMGNTTYPSGSGGIDTLLNQWVGGPGGADNAKDWTQPSFYGNEGNRNMMEGYNTLFATPLFNAQMAARTQGFNELTGNRNFDEQHLLNQSQMGLAGRGQDLQEKAFAFSQQTNGRDFQETVRQANMGNKLAQSQLSELSQFHQGQVQNQGQQIGNEMLLGSQANRTNQQKVSNDYNLGMGTNQNQGQQIKNEFALGNQANANQRYGMTNDFNLGQGNLNLGNRTLDTTNAFNKQSLAQDKLLAKNKNATDIMNQRYATFGRGSAPNPREALSWR